MSSIVVVKFAGAPRRAPVLSREHIKSYQLHNSAMAMTETRLPPTCRFRSPLIRFEKAIVESLSASVEASLEGGAERAISRIAKCYESGQILASGTPKPYAGSAQLFRFELPRRCLRCCGCGNNE